MPDDFFAGAFGRAYSAYMERPWLSRIVARVIWGSDIRPFYASMSAIEQLPQGATVVDAPCGAGPAFRAIPPGGSLRYVAVDLSESMLARARERARARGLTQIEAVRGDACDLPLESDSTDLFLSYWGLHCFAQPAQALREAARVLRPGGELVGATFVRGDSMRQRLLIVPDRGAFGAVGTRPDLERWLTEAGFVDSVLESSDTMLFFTARAA